eukprot:371688-Prymnesium_polylepis.1
MSAQSSVSRCVTSPLVADAIACPQAMPAASVVAGAAPPPTPSSAFSRACGVGTLVSRTNESTFATTARVGRGRCRRAGAPHAAPAAT